MTMASLDPSSDRSQERFPSRDRTDSTRVNEENTHSQTMSLSPRSPAVLATDHGPPSDVNTQPSPTGLDHPLASATGTNLPPRPPILPRFKEKPVSHELPGAPILTVEGSRDEDDDDMVSHMSNPDFRQDERSAVNGGVLTNPLESEAEAYIQRTLDEIDPTIPGISEAQRTILGCVPEDAQAEVFMEDGTGPTPRATTHSQAATTSAAEDLFQLTSDLSILNQQHGMSTRGLSALDSLRIDGSDEHLSDQDKLIKNAATLMKRNNVNPKESPFSQRNDKAGHNSKAVNSAHDRWAALKKTVHKGNASTSSRDLGKKTDEPGMTDHQDPEDDIESNKGQSPNHFNHEEGTVRADSGLGRSHPLRATARQKIKSRYKDFEEWLKFKKMSIYAYVKFMLFFIIVPAIGVAAILFYAVGNPPCGTTDECNEALQTRTVVLNSTGDNGIISITRDIFEDASASWWILFILCRQPITLSLSLATQSFIIDFLALRSKWAVKLVGPFVTLFIVQSKGWPFIVFCWGLYNFALLYGSSKWASHWLYWQDVIDLFNEKNPSGNFTSAPEYKSVLIVAVAVSAVVAVKRFWVGLWFGKKTYHRYADDLTAAMKKSLLIGQVAGLARDKEALGLDLGNLGIDVKSYCVYHDEPGSNASVGSHGALEVATSPKSGVTNEGTTKKDKMVQQANLSSEQKIRIDELLGAWEEPDTTHGKDMEAPIAAIIQFRQSLSYLNSAFPFSAAFGSAANRTECVGSAEAVYKRLLGNARILEFDAIASLAMSRNGEMNEEKLKALIKLFRPERDGSLSLVDFVKSIDSVYKELRLLRASVANSTKMDASFETLFNVFFYFIMVCVVLSFLGIDPIVLFASISGFVIGFAFMIGSALSKYFEGILFIVYRRPYNIGDRINVSNPIVDTPSDGSAGWIVKDVDLFTTTVLYASTNEVATYSNSSLAACRIINGARSQKAAVNFKIKFPLEVTYDKLQVFKGAVEEFIKARPREWRTFGSFRVVRVEVDLGFVEYSVSAEHRESWQQASMVGKSKAELTSFCLELSKKMNLRYRSPPRPVDLNFKCGAVAFPSSGSVPEHASHHSAGIDGDYPNTRSRSNTVESFDWRTVSCMFDQNKK